MDINAHCVIALLFRLILLFYGIFQDKYFEVKYTDIDYHVFTDAANFVHSGQSPFKRHTYRYTPLLALMLTLNIVIHHAVGKLLFCILDVVTGLLIFQIQKNYNYSIKICKFSAFLWLYNPICAVISTRGNSESIMTCLIMMSILFYQTNRPILFGLVYGFSVHVKIYPAIYALTFYAALSHFPQVLTSWKKFSWMFFPNQNKIFFLVSAIMGFLIPTILSFYLFGLDYINEALLHHLIRKDIRHNFSPFFYILYLSESVDAEFGAVISFTAFLIQATLIALISWVFYTPQMLPSCLFLQTFLFVTFNKVCTSQYFSWYLCLFSLNVATLNVNFASVIQAILLWLFGQTLWLIPAYYLEFQGMNTFIFLWLASLVMFSFNVYLATMFIKLSPQPWPVTKLEKEIKKIE